LWDTTCASLSLFGNEAFSIVLFISIVIGLLTIGFAIFKFFTEILSLPVALLTFILSICFSTNEISIDSNFNLFFNITNKGSYFENNIILTDDDRIVNDQNEVAETFNDFFVNVAKDIGKDI
jgi:ABC-type multidrug transport system permease subunit